MEIGFLALRKLRRMMRSSPRSRISQDRDLSYPSYQLDLQDFKLNPTLPQSSSPTQSAEVRVPGSKFLVVTEAQENYLRTLGINLRPSSFTKECDLCADAFPLSAYMSTEGFPHIYCLNCCEMGCPHEHCLNCCKIGEVSDGCPHEYCLTCCKRHAEARVTSGSLQVECPDLSCTHSFSLDQSRTLLSQSHFDALNNRLVISAIEVSLRLFCPYPSCSELMEKSDSGGTFAECFFCHREFCQACSVPWHNNQTCGEYRASELNSRLSGDQKLRDLAQQQKWQTCPDCKTFVMRTEGCKHMTCVCKVHFCYLCGKKYVNSTPNCNC